MNMNTLNYISSNKPKFTTKKIRKLRAYTSVFCMFFLIFTFHSYASDGFVKDLRRNGFSLIPSPQKTELTGKVIVLDNSWVIETKPGVNSFIMNTLQSKANELHGINFSAKGGHKIILDI